MFRGKRYKENAKLVERGKLCWSKGKHLLLLFRQQILSSMKPSNFMCVSVSTRDTLTSKFAAHIVLPNGTGKNLYASLSSQKRVIANEAREAGADYVGDQDMIDKIQREN